MAMLRQRITPNDMERVVQRELYSGNVTTECSLTTKKMMMMTLLATVEECWFEVGETGLQLQVTLTVNIEKKCCRHRRNPHHQSFCHRLHHQRSSILTKQKVNHLITKLPQTVHVPLPSRVPIPVPTQKRTLKVQGSLSQLAQPGVEENQSSRTDTLKTDTVAVVVLSTGLEIRDAVLCIMRKQIVMWTMMGGREEER